MSGHIHWSSKDQNFGKEMIAWNAISRILQQEGIPSIENAKQIIGLAQLHGANEASEKMEDEGHCNVQELINDSNYIIALDSSETILLNMSETPEQRKAVKDICALAASSFEEAATKVSTKAHGI